MAKRGYTARMMFTEFRKARPEFWRPGTNYRLAGYMKIEIMSPGVGRFLYSPTLHTIEWLERWVDPKYIKKIEKLNRPDDYLRFIEELKTIMETKKLTQEAISLVSGVSRQSINAYLSGRKIPKTSTMRKIGNPLGIDI